MAMADSSSRRHGSGRSVLGGVVVWLTSAGTILLLSAILTDVHVKSFPAALAAALLVGVINALVWPLILWLALPLTVLTLGLGVVVVNGAVVWLVSAIEAGLQISSLTGGIIVALVITAVNTTVTSLLAIDDDRVWQRYMVRRQQRRVGRKLNVRTDVPGLFFVEIDGLAHDVLMRAIRDGNAPGMASWLREGSHRLERWETDWSSQTGACQAGLLHGDNHDMPAFRWWEKDRGAAIVTNHPRDAMELERRHSNGRGLLFSDGASRANIVSGDAPESLLTMSTVMNRRRPIGRDYSAYFARPYAAARTFFLALADIARERSAAAYQRRQDVVPRIPRSRMYAVVRAWGTVVQLDLQIAAVVGD